MKNLVSLVAFAALALLLMSFVSAVNVDLNAVEVNGVDTPAHVALSAGQTVPVKIIFSSDSNLSDVRVKAWITGNSEISISSDRFDMIADRSYSKLLMVQVPSNIDPSEEMNLVVVIEDETNGILESQEFPMTIQRENYNVDFLDVMMDSKVSAGQNLAVDFVLKNKGTHFAEDTFVKATIPQLGVERRVYFGDLSPVDQADPDKEDAAERVMYLSIPSDAPAGIYNVQFEAYNADSSTTVTKKIAVVGAGANSRIVPAVSSKSFAVGEKAVYAITLVNSGDSARIYEISFDAPEGVTLSADENIFAVPTGSSKTVNVEASAAKAGTYQFAVNVNSDGELVKKENFTAQVSSKGISTGANTTIVLTVVLAIVFIVLLVVLVVLLTRKPQKSEEPGESYY